jgi:hypothetical protein
MNLCRHCHHRINYSRMYYGEYWWVHVFGRKDRKVLWSG